MRNAAAKGGGIHVVLVAPTLEVLGGQAVQASVLAGALRNKGHEVTLLPVNPNFPAGLQWVRRYRFVRTLLNQALYLPSLMRLRHAVRMARRARQEVRRCTWPYVREAWTSVYTGEGP